MKYAKTRRLGQLLAATIISFGLNGVAHAKITTIFSAGYWNVVKGTTAKNSLMCGMTTQNRSGSWVFSIDYFPHTPVLQIELIKETWRIPENTKIPVILQIGSSHLYTATATGDNHQVYWFIPRHLARQFSYYFMKSNNMTVIFKSGDEPPWQLNLTGSSAAFRQFVRCMKAINAAGSPHGSSQPTQPFNAAPTQPFGSPPPRRSQPQPAPGIPRNDNTSPPGNSPSYQHV